MTIFDSTDRYAYNLKAHVSYSLTQSPSQRLAHLQAATLWLTNSCLPFVWHLVFVVTDGVHRGPALVHKWKPKCFFVAVKWPITGGR